MSCSKPLDFAGPAGAHLSFYWTMDEGGTVPRVDSAVGLSWPGDFPIHPNAGVPPATAGLFGNAINMDQSWPIWQGMGLVNSPSLAFNSTTSKGISMWFWVKFVTTDTPSLAMTFEPHDSVLPNDSAVSLEFNYGGWSVEHFDYSGPNPTVFINGAWGPPALGAWHMMCATMDLVNHTLNFYLDAVLAGTIADMNPLYTADEGDLFWYAILAGLAPHVNCVADEMGVSLKGALTPAQVTALWNGGAGVTWPTVTTIVPFP